MRYKCLIVPVTVICFFGILVQTMDAQEKGAGQINWVGGYISAVGEGTSTPSGNKMKDQLMAIRAATIMAQRVLLETVKEVRIDSQTKVENRMVQEDLISTRIEGTVQGSEIARQGIRWEGDTPVATVELRICLSGVGACNPEKSIVSALNLDQKNGPAHVPQQRLNDMPSKEKTTPPKIQDIVYDLSRPVTGIVFYLQGLHFEREILPVVITIGERNTPFTVYSVKSVDPEIIRTYGVVRYTDSIEQAKQNPRLGENIMIIPVSDVTQENMIVIRVDAARLIRETTRHGNDYLKQAKVIISAK